MDRIDIFLKEYNNLWNEKILHKQSLRKFHNYISYLISIGSLALTFKGISTTDIMKNTIKNIDVSKSTEYIKILENAADAIMLLCVPLTPIILLVASYAINDLFQIYVIGTQIGNIEKKINTIVGSPTLLWEHHICPVVYGGEITTNGKLKEKVTNIIRINDKLIFLPFIIIVCVLSSIVGAQYIFDKFGLLFYRLYIIIIVYFIVTNLWLLWKLNEYTQADSQLSKILTILNKMENEKKSKK